jgi:hypothetical protein
VLYLPLQYVLNVVVCGFRGASASKAICACLTIEGKYNPRVYALFPSKMYKIQQLSADKINSNIRTQQRNTGRAE